MPPRPFSPRFVLTTTALFLVAAPSWPATAQEDEPVSPLDEPLNVTDAFATKPGEADLELSGGYRRERGRRGRDSWPVTLELQAGLARNLEATIGISETFGNSSSARSGGTVDLGLLYQLNEESGALPAFAVSGRVGPRFGPGDEGTETELRLLASKTTGGAPALRRPSQRLLDRPHRPGLRRAAGPLPLRRGADPGVTDDTAIAPTCVREQQERGERDLNLVSVGLRHRLPNGGTSVGLLGGVGVGEDSPRFQVIAGVVHSFAWGGGGRR